MSLPAMRFLPGLVLIFLCAAGAAQAPDQDALTRQLDEVRQRIGHMQQRLDSHLADRDLLAEELASAERDAGAARRAQLEIEQQLEQVQTGMTELEAQEQELLVQVHAHSSRLGQQLLLAYRQGSSSRLKMLLNQDDPQRLSRQMFYHRYLSQARMEALAELRLAVEALLQTRSQLQEEIHRLNRLLAEHDTETRRLEAARAERAVALEAMEKRVTDDRQQLAQLQENAAELSQLLDDLADVMADLPADMTAPPFGQLRGRLAMPVKGQVKRAFGQPRGHDLRWTGWLITTRPGEPVLNIAHGRVAYAEWLRGYGLLLIMDHGEGYMSLYAHNEALLRDVGDWVGPGEALSLAGQSGGEAETALYFEIRHNGQPQDPASWLRR